MYTKVSVIELATLYSLSQEKLPEIYCSQYNTYRIVCLLCKLQFNRMQAILTCLILCTDWNKDWKPGPYPVTPEERAAAARKYGLRPDEYKPIPDDGIGAGDYPDLPLVSAESRDPYYPWDHPEHRRDFMEPVC